MWTFGAPGAATDPDRAKAIQTTLRHFMRRSASESIFRPWRSRLFHELATGEESESAKSGSLIGDAIAALEFFEERPSAIKRLRNRLVLPTRSPNNTQLFAVSNFPKRVCFDGGR